MIDRRPGLIARCADVLDVVATVQFAGERGLALAVRGGAVRRAGLAVADDAVVCDLSGLRRVEVDPERRIVRADAGATWGDVTGRPNAIGWPCREGSSPQLGSPG